MNLLHNARRFGAVARLRPYVAIVQDSFREVLVSPLMWVVLGLFTLLPLGFAPLGIHEELTTSLPSEDVTSWPEMALQLRRGAQRDEPSAQKHIWSLMSSSARDKLTEIYADATAADVTPLQHKQAAELLHIEMNRLVVRDELFDPALWKQDDLRLEARQLARSPARELEPQQRWRLNRLALEAAFPELILPSPPTSVRFQYFGNTLGPPLPIRKERFDEILRPGIVLMMQWIVGPANAAGIFVAILFTAPLVPRTFEPSSLSLLLSKPISRTLLFLTKFLGGCTFVLVCGGYLIVSIWLLLGIRFGIWFHQLLLTIPVYVFTFAIYYSVSAWAGLKWRSAVVAVAVTIAFWLTCFVVGTGKAAMEQSYFDKQRLVKLVPAAGQLIAVNEMGLTYQWDEGTSAWHEARLNREYADLKSMLYFLPASPPMMGPVYDANHDRLVAIQRSLQSQQFMLAAATRENDWEYQYVTKVPLGAVALLQDPHGPLIIPASAGIFRVDWSTNEQESRVTFTEIGPEQRVPLIKPAAAAMHPTSGDLALVSMGKLTRLVNNGAGRYEVAASIEIDIADNVGVTLAYADNAVTVGFADGRVVIYDNQLKPRREFQVEHASEPRFALASPDGRWAALVYHNRHAWLLDSESMAVKRIPADGNDISAVGFLDDGRMLIAERGRRVWQLEITSGEQLVRCRPRMSMVEMSYYYVLSPVYALFPKPGELDQTIQYLLSGNAAERSALDGGDLKTYQAQRRPWSPVWSSLVFVLVVLALSSRRIHREEF